MYASFDDIINAACARKTKRTIAIAAAEDDKMVHVAQAVTERGLCGVIMVGNAEGMKKLMRDAGLSEDSVELVDEQDPARLGLTAAKLVREGRADILVKGKMNTSDFLRAVLDKDCGLRSSGQLNVLTCYDEPGEKKLFFITDGGMTIAPTLHDKAEILKNAVPVLHRMGIAEPKVALLAANEKVNPKMPATVDAAELCRMAERGELPRAIYEGPIAFDVAMRPEPRRRRTSKAVSAATWTSSSCRTSRRATAWARR